jgi:competence protein ComEA
MLVLMTALYTHSVSRLSTNVISRLVIVFAISIGASAQQLPDGPGKAELVKVCSQCHEVARSVSLRQDRAGWATTMTKMVTLGTKAPEKDLQAVFEYLVANFPADDVPRLNINTAESIEIESALGMKRSQAAALIQYRTKNGPFKSIEDLKKVPGIDAAKIESKRDRLIF